MLIKSLTLKSHGLVTSGTLTMMTPSTARKISATSPVEFPSWTKKASTRSCQSTHSTLKTLNAKSLVYRALIALGRMLSPGLWTSSGITHTSIIIAISFLCTNPYKSLCSLPTLKKYMASKSKQLIAKPSIQDSSLLH